MKGMIFLFFVISIILSSCANFVEDKDGPDIQPADEVRLKEKGYSYDLDGVIHFSWEIAPGEVDYYDVYIAVDPNDPFNPDPASFRFAGTSCQPFFVFLGQRDHIYVCQTQAAGEVSWLVFLLKNPPRYARYADAPRYTVRREVKIQENKLIDLAELITDVKRMKVFVETTIIFGPKSEPSYPVKCLKTGEDVPGLTRIP